MFETELQIEFLILSKEKDDSERFYLLPLIACVQFFAVLFTHCLICNEGISVWKKCHAH